jgi:hypothetical protein
VEQLFESRADDIFAVESSASHSNRKREAWSVTVNGQQERPLPSLNSPLKSAHHRSLGAAPSGVPLTGRRSAVEALASAALDRSRLTLNATIRQWAMYPCRAAGDVAPLN